MPYYFIKNYVSMAIWGLYEGVRGKETVQSNRKNIKKFKAVYLWWEVKTALNITPV